MKKNSKTILFAVAGITAVVGAAVAIATYLKRKAKTIKEELDFDPNIYLEDEDSYEDPVFNEYPLDEEDTNKSTIQSNDDVSDLDVTDK